MSEVTYYFDKRTSDWDNNPSYMHDNILTNYASTDSVGDSELLYSNTCLGTDLGTITKVELRAYAYGDGGDKLKIRPIFDGQPGDTYETVPKSGSPGDWGSYVDITTDTYAPSPWTWGDVVTLDSAQQYDSTGKANMMYCAKVEVRVTYTPSAVGARTHAYIFG